MVSLIHLIFAHLVLILLYWRFNQGNNLIQNKRIIKIWRKYRLIELQRQLGIESLELLVKIILIGLQIVLIVRILRLITFMLIKVMIRKKILYWIILIIKIMNKLIPILITPLILLRFPQLKIGERSTFKPPLKLYSQIASILKTSIPLIILLKAKH